MNEFIDHDGVYLPYPGVAHPAIEQYREQLDGQDAVTVTIPLSTRQALHFVRTETVAQDFYGVTWRWTVWIDQYGRALSENDPTVIAV